MGLLGKCHVEDGFRHQVGAIDYDIHFICSKSYSSLWERIRIHSSSRDPLSPYVFIICAEALTSLIRTRENDGLVHGCRMARGTPPISHLFFTDDCFLYFHANVL